MDTNDVKDTLAIINEELGISDDRDVTAYDNLQKWLAAHVLEWMRNDFDRLINTLYIIDVNEQKAKVAIHQHRELEAADQIATLIIERSWQKVITRRKYNSNEGLDFPEAP